MGKIVTIGVAVTRPIRTERAKGEFYLLQRTNIIGA